MCAHQASRKPLTSAFPLATAPWISVHSPMDICPLHNTSFTLTFFQQPLLVHPPTSRTLYGKDESYLHLPTRPPSKIGAPLPAAPSIVRHLK